MFASSCFDLAQKDIDDARHELQRLEVECNETPWWRFIRLMVLINKYANAQIKIDKAKCEFRKLFY